MKSPESSLHSRDASHPEPLQLARLIRGELLRAEVLVVVRHLLTGCPRCTSVTQRLWMLGEPSAAEESRDSEAVEDQARWEYLRAGAVWT